MNPLYYVRKAVNEPELVKPFVVRSWKQLKHGFLTGRKKNQLVRQKDLIRSVLEEESFLVVVLDACRYDIFREVNFLEGDLIPVYSSGRDTFEYVRNTFQGEYSFTYVSGAVPVNSENLVFDDDRFNDLYAGYRPADHLQVVDAWKDAWMPDKGTVEPEKVTDIALDNLTDRMFVHYFQPHAPFIGEEEEVLHGSTDPVNGEPGDKQVWQRVENGEISDERLEVLYRSNLKRVLGEVEDLIAETSFDKVVVTADHGECLGEDGFYGHPRTVNHRKVRVVPWLEVEA